MKLLDVNVWLAAAWARHAHHRRVKAWLDQDEGPRAFCGVTQMSLLRLITNASVIGQEARTRRQAWDLMDHLLADPRIDVLPEPDNLVPLWMALSKRDDRNHALWTDDYLAAFAVAAELEVVTLDRPFRARYPSAQVVVLA